jgi:uncharacterized protein (TIGR02301 family)
MRRLAAVLVVTLPLLAPPAPALAIDPPYQGEMEHLAETLGSLYFLDPLCKRSSADWRLQMGDLISLDLPDDDRRQRLIGAFNDGYEAYARLYRVCTVSASDALDRLLVDAETTARDIGARYAE